MTQLTINPDQTVSAAWSGKRGRGSLYQIMADGNVKLVNALDARQLMLVLLLVKINPFPVPGFTGTRQATLAAAKQAIAEDPALLAKAETFTLGEFRKSLVAYAGDSCNGPVDGWLKWAVENKAQL